MLTLYCAHSQTQVEFECSQVPHIKHLHLILLDTHTHKQIGVCCRCNQNEPTGLPQAVANGSKMNSEPMSLAAQVHVASALGVMSHQAGVGEEQKEKHKI